MLSKPIDLLRKQRARNRQVYHGLRCGSLGISLSRGAFSARCRTTNSKSAVAGARDVVTRAVKIWFAASTSSR